MGVVCCGKGNAGICSLLSCVHVILFSQSLEKANCFVRTLCMREHDAERILWAGQGLQIWLDFMVCREQTVYQNNRNENRKALVGKLMVVLALFRNSQHSCTEVMLTVLQIEAAAAARCYGNKMCIVQPAFQHFPPTKMILNTPHNHPSATFFIKLRPGACLPGNPFYGGLNRPKDTRNLQYKTQRTGSGRMHILYLYVHMHSLKGVCCWRGVISLERRRNNGAQSS